MPQIADTCWFTAGSSGAADFSDGTGVVGARNLADAGAVSGKTYSYRAEHPTDKSIWENGYGAFTSGAPGTLARTTIVASSAGGAKINFATNPLVLLTDFKRDWDLIVHVDQDQALTAAQRAQALKNIAPVTRTISGAGESITIADWGKLILFSSASARTVAIAAISTLPDGFWCDFENRDEGLFTLDPDAAETIDGAATSLVPKGDRGRLHRTAAGLVTTGRPAICPISKVSFSSATAELIITLPNGWNQYRIRYWDWTPVTDEDALYARTSLDGSTFPTTGYSYTYGYESAQPTNGLGGTMSSSFMFVQGSSGNGSAHGGAGIIDLTNIRGGLSYGKMVCLSTYFRSSTSSFLYMRTSNQYASSGEWAKIKFFASTGNMAKGTFALDGIR